MNSRSFSAHAAAGLLALSLLPSLTVAKSGSDLVSTEKRRGTVSLAQQLTRPAEPAPVPSPLVNPFNPPGFDQPDPEEVRANAAAAAAAGAKAGGAVAPGGGAAGAEAPTQQQGDRELLENLAMKLGPGGTVVFGGAPMLIIGKNRFEVGSHFIVAFNNQDYELELVSIANTTFTLRYNGVEVTRPIRPGKSQ